MRKLTINKFFDKIIILTLTVILAFSLAGCSEIRLASALDDDILVQIEDETVSSAEGLFRLMELIESYGDTDETFFARSVGDITMDEYLKESVEEEMVMLACMVFIADDLAIYLTDDEIAQSALDAEEAFFEISLEYDTTAWGITLEDVENLYEKQALYEKVYSELTDSVTMEISETDTKVIEVNFVLFPEDTTIDEAERLRAKISAGVSFESACEALGYEPYMNITIKKGDMVSAFESVAFALSDGELSECTETVDGIYLIECVEDYLEAESAANYNAVITEAKDEIFETTYSDFLNSVEIRINDSFWEDISAAGL